MLLIPAWPGYLDTCVLKYDDIHKIIDPNIHVSHWVSTFLMVATCQMDQSWSPSYWSWYQWSHWDMEETSSKTVLLYGWLDDCWLIRWYYDVHIGSLLFLLRVTVFVLCRVVWCCADNGDMKKVEREKWDTWQPDQNKRIFPFSRYIQICRLLISKSPYLHIKSGQILSQYS